MPLTESDILSRDDLSLIAEIGFMACGARHVSAATRIFEGLRVLRPQAPGPLLGLAMARMSANDPDAAVQLLESDGQRLHPGDDDIRVFLGIALREAGRQGESERVLNGLSGDTTPARRLARAVLADRDGDPSRPASGLAALLQRPVASPMGLRVDTGALLEPRIVVQ